MLPQAARARGISRGLTEQNFLSEHNFLRRLSFLSKREILLASALKFSLNTIKYMISDYYWLRFDQTIIHLG